MHGKQPDAIDRLVGRNIRLHRLKIRMSQEKLAAALCITFQQLQKYERGENRVGSGRLFRISTILGVPVTAMFEGTDPPSGPVDMAMLDLLAEPHSMRLLQALAEITDVDLRRKLVELAERLAARHSSVRSSFTPQAEAEQAPQQFGSRSSNVVTLPPRGQPRS